MCWHDYIVLTIISLLANAQVFNNRLFGSVKLIFHNNKNSIELLTLALIHEKAACCCYPQ